MSKELASRLLSAANLLLAEPEPDPIASLIDQVKGFIPESRDNRNVKDALDALQAGDLEEAFDLFDQAASDFESLDEEELQETAHWFVNEIDSLL